MMRGLGLKLFPVVEKLGLSDRSQDKYPLYRLDKYACDTKKEIGHCFLPIGATPCDFRCVRLIC